MNFTTTSFGARFALSLSIFMLLVAPLIGQTTSQLTLLKDIQVGTVGSNPENLTSLFNKVVFTADDGINGKELWASDGTQAGTTLIKDFVVGSGSPTFSPFVEFGGTAFFTVTFNETPQRIELWKTDGTPLSTIKVFSFTDAMAGSTFFLGNMFTANNKVYVPMTALLPGQTTDNSLWESNGFSAGTRNIGSMISSFQNTVTPSYYYEKGQPVFCMTASVSCSEPLATGSIIVIDSSGIKTRVPFGSISSPGACYAKTLGVMGRNLYFLQANTVSPTPSTKVSLFKVNTDGVKTVVIDSFSTYSRMTNALSGIRSVTSNNWLYFFYEMQMWKSDGTTFGTVPITTRQSDTEPTDLMTSLVDGDAVYFTDNFSRFRYWRSINGSKPVLLGSESSPLLFISLLKKVGNKIYSFGNDPTDMPNPLIEIKSTDGQTPFIKIAESRQIRYIPSIGSISNALFFGFNDATKGLEIGTLNLNAPVIAPCDTDRIAPVISSCPQNINLTTTGTSAVASWTTPTATDNCTATPSVSSNYTSGSPFGIGTTMVTYTATDAKNNTATCRFNITVTASTATANCTSKSSAPWSEWIAQVQLNTLNNVSEKTRADRYVVGYSDWKDKSTTLSRSQTYPLSITPGLSWSGYQTNLFFRAWIDFNANGIYEDTELVLEKNSLSSAVNQSITIPATAVLGTTTMRVSMKKDAYPTACETFAAGEVEDYSVLITNGTVDPCATDVTPPVLSSCPINSNYATNTTTAIVSWTTPTATDNCGTPSVSSTYNSGFAFPIGTTTVVYTARDAANNTITCAFSVVVSASTVTPNCVSKSNAPWSEWISNVQFNTLNNTSSKTRDDRFVVGYSDWKDKSTTVSRSQTHPLSIKPGLSWPGYITPLYFRAWIDFNRNGIYEDSELVLEKNSNSAVVNQSVTIPATASIGTTTMRISMKKGAYATACESFDLGEVEDYTVVIQDGGDPCAADVTPPVVINCPQNIVLTNTTNQCKMVSFTPPSATDNCTLPAYSAILKNGSQFLNFIPTTNADLIIGRWDIGSSYEKTIDAAGNILSSVLLPASYGVTSVFQNGVYTTLTSSGKWELSVDGTKFIGDKGAADERYYKIIALSTTEWKEIGPYRLDGTPYFGNKLYEYWASKKPNMFVNICPNIPTDTVLFTFNDAKGNTSTCRFNITITQAVNTCRYNDSLVLVDVYNSMGGANWVNKWDLTKPMNTWMGIGTDTNGCVIAFSSGQLMGNLAPSIGNLSQLRYMRLGGSRAITGTIPNSFANLSNLIELQIEDNQLTGNIPSFVGNLRNLNQILLYKNMLTGPIPTTFGNLNKMQWLILNNNQLSGTIPSNLSNMTLLNALELSNNSFTGSIPNVFGEIPSVTYLGLKNNNFSGTLPKNLAQLTNINKLDLSNNLLSGCIPNELKPLCGKDVILSGNVNLPNGGDWAAFCSTNAGACPVTNDLEVSVSANALTFKKWTNTGFKVNLKNLGSQSFTNIELTFPYPAGTVNGGTPTPSVGTFQQYCAGGILCYKWTIPSLAAGATATLDVPLFALDVATILGTAQLLTSTPTDGNATNNTATATMTLQTIVPSLTSKPTQLIPVVIQTLSPNPTDGELNLKLESLDTREVTFEFYNALGKAVKSEKRVVEKGLNRVGFSLFDLEQGVYFVVPSTGQGRKVPTKFVKM